MVIDDGDSSTPDRRIQLPQPGRFCRVEDDEQIGLLQSCLALRFPGRIGRQVSEQELERVRETGRVYDGGLYAAAREVEGQSDLASGSIAVSIDMGCEDRAACRLQFRAKQL